MKKLTIKEVRSGGKIIRTADSNKELLVYMKLIKIMKRIGVKF
jgi:hypothetical protein